jgi:hypothetical protein
MMVWPQIWLALKPGRVLMDSVGMEKLLHETWEFRVFHRN